MGGKTDQTMAPSRMSPMDVEERQGGIVGKDVEFANGLGLNLRSATGVPGGPLRASVSLPVLKRE